MGRRQDEDRMVLGHLTATPMRGRGVRPDGRRYWRIRTRDTRETVATGWWTRAEVDAAIAAALTAPRSSPRSRPGVVRTVGELLDAWAAVQAQRRDAGEIAERSLVNYRQAARHWKSAIADVLASELTRELAEDTLRGWRASGAMAPRSAKLAADVLRAVVRWGAPRGHCPAVELEHLGPAQVHDEEHVNCERTPTRAESDGVLAAIPPGRDHQVVELLALTGARVGEVAALTVGSWDRARGVLAISGRDRRRERRGKVATRAFPVLGRLGDLLEELAADRPVDEPLVVGLPRDVADLAGRVLERACEAVGVERYTAHGLRRLVAEELLEQSGNAKAVARLTGHSVAVLLQSYIRPSDDQLREIVARAARRPAVLRVVGAHEPGTNDQDGE